MADRLPGAHRRVPGAPGGGQRVRRRRNSPRARDPSLRAAAQTGWMAQFSPRRRPDSSVSVRTAEASPPGSARNHRGKRRDPYRNTGLTGTEAPENLAGAGAAPQVLLRLRGARLPSGWVSCMCIELMREEERHMATLRGMSDEDKLNDIEI